MKLLFTLFAITSTLTGTAAEFSIATFTADVTVPAGHGMMGGLWKSESVEDPLFAKGVIIVGGEKPVAFVSVDWCEIRNDAYDRWREEIAVAAGTTRERVLVSSIHQHDAPIADLSAQRLLEQRKLEGSICDLEFHEIAVKRVGAAVNKAMQNRKPITHLGVGKAKVKKIASNRRYELPDGKYSYGRGSSSGRNVLARNAPEGTIDPWLRTLSFWNNDKPLAALSGYATHPMSYYRTGKVSADFPGMARARRQKDTPGCLQVYFSGASGNVTAGKYNDGARTNRLTLANKLYDGMKTAWEATKRIPLEQVDFRNTEVFLEPRNHSNFTAEHLNKELQPGVNHWKQCLAAMGMSWRKRVNSGQPIDMPVIDFGKAQLLLLPAEIYVEYQLAAQAMRPDSFVVVAGYGESAPGYIPTEKNWKEKDSNLGDWCWVHPGAEKPLMDAVRRVLIPAP
ncbi:MAG: hypothetical protein CMO80_06325 [Verrucomicrobiales bacterium]|nr:hypothetical protein [Verrucomicrobiales bacterium]|tara:strand:- start:280 stop:1635 length:1356 start_codon:yes stop_codon:yes gene_type:complete